MLLQATRSLLRLRWAYKREHLAVKYSELNNYFIYLDQHYKSYRVYQPAKLRMATIGSRYLTTTGVSIKTLSPDIQSFVEVQAKLCKPDQIHVCDGSEEESKAILEHLMKDGRLEKLPKYNNW